MMYSFGSRSDFAVWDEPFYAPYLAVTGAAHPMRDDILDRHETDPQSVADACLGPIPGGKAHVYMKHMSHHMVAGFPLNWARDCTNIHLIRHPARVIASYLAKRENPTLADIGFAQQLRLYEKVGGIVVDSLDIRADPIRALAALCERISLPFNDAMLRWPRGGHPSDGVWAAHWYGAVHRSTGFAGPEGPLPDLDGEAAQLLEAATPFYETLAAEKVSL